MRSRVPARVVYRSRGKPQNSEPAVLRTTRSPIPARTWTSFPSAVATGPHLAPGLAEGVVVLHAPDGDPFPAVGLHHHAGAGDPVVGAGEVPGQAQAERFGRADAVPREGEDGVLLGVGRQHVAVVAGGVRGGEVPAQARADIEVHEPVPW